MRVSNNTRQTPVFSSHRLFLWVTQSKVSINAALLSFTVLMLSLLVLAPSTAFAADKAKELEWSDLVPEDYQAEIPTSIEHIGQAMAGPQSINAPVVEALDGQFVKIPGFVVPLEGDDELVTEFLLVPYFGACVHVPPPPSNQVIHVTMEKGAPASAFYDPIWLIGTISTESWKGDLAQVGYKMVGLEVAPYDDF